MSSESKKLFTECPMPSTPITGKITIYNRLMIIVFPRFKSKCSH